MSSYKFLLQIDRSLDHFLIQPIGSVGLVRFSFQNKYLIHLHTFSLPSHFSLHSFFLPNSRLLFFYLMSHHIVSLTSLLYLYLTLDGNWNWGLIILFSQIKRFIKHYVRRRITRRKQTMSPSGKNFHQYKIPTNAR